MRSAALQVLLLIVAFMLGGAVCDSARAENPASKTMMEIEILLPGKGASPLLGQEWRRVFEEVGEGVRLRQPIGDEAPKIQEIPRGPFRTIRLVGELTREGSLVFPGKTFKSTQALELKEWIGELQTYGAQGSPDGKPMWGLTQEQFTGIFEKLKKPVETPLVGVSVDEAIREICPDSVMKVAFHSSVSDVPEKLKTELVGDEVKGLAAGTALAFVLSQEGLGFRPLRTPTGEIQLTVQMLKDMKDPWPVGWPIDDKVARDRLVPGVFKKVETGVAEAPLTAVVNVIEERSETIILVDRLSALVRGFDPEEKMVAYPRKKTAWILILNQISVNSYLNVNYRQDENSKNFLYLTPFEHYRAKPKPEAKK
ncbi:hypothetical protein SH668x_001091 [Planctomicrobium sp. SH668]|uniref:hypothetical protein n=1 Tax=Planctomicrobium sp. SH668 TaxID=3448126 RepID=UPI003F5B6119